MNLPGTITVNENVDFDEVVFADDTDEYQKFQGGVLIGNVSLGNPDGNVSALVSQPNEVNSGAVLTSVLSSTVGGKNTYTVRRTARSVTADTTCIDRFRAYDMTDQVNSPTNKVYDSNVVDFQVIVVVKNT